MKFPKRSLSSFAVVIISIVGVLGAVSLFFHVYDLILKTYANDIDASTYQAVFLTNNQVYFGILGNINSQYPVLTDIYYVKLTGNQETSEDQNRPSTGKLVPLGKDEPHGPTNKMIINRDQILFWENLSSDSQIIRLIADIKKTE